MIHKQIEEKKISLQYITNKHQIPDKLIKLLLQDSFFALGVSIKFEK